MSAYAASMSARPGSAHGFTLVELMFAVAIVGILVAVAYPTFTQQISKSRRADAKSTLLGCAQMLERYNTQSGNYSAATDAAVTSACVGTTKNGYYSLPGGNIPTTAGAGTFLIQATPLGRQAGDACGTFSYTQDGTKGVSGATLASASCW